MGMYLRGGGSHSTQGPPSYRVWGGGEGASTHLCPTYNQTHAGFSFSYLRFAEAASFDKKELRRSCTGVFRNIDPLPLTVRRMCTPPPLVRGEDTLAGGRGGGGSIVRKPPDTALYSINVSTLWDEVWKQQGDLWIFFHMYYLSTGGGSLG